MQKAVIIAVLVGISLQYQKIQFAKSLVDGMLNASFDTKNKKVAIEDSVEDVAAYTTSLSDSDPPQELVKGFGLFNTKPESSAALIFDGSKTLISGNAADFCKEADGCTIDPAKKSFEESGIQYNDVSLATGFINSFPKVTNEIYQKLEQKANIYFVGD